MDIKELRIGNLVKTCTPNMDVMIPTLESKVQGITLFEQVMFSYKPTSISGFKMDCKHVAGIPLTEEWLVKFGFEKIETTNKYFPEVITVHYQNEYCWVYLLPNSFEVEWIVQDDRFNLLKNYKLEVHLFQNLYFAFTQQELEIL